jgi:Predicted membrane protein
MVLAITLLVVVIGVGYLLLKWPILTQTPSGSILEQSKLQRLLSLPSEWMRSRTYLWHVFEIGAIALWAAWVGRAFLDFSPETWLPGIEFHMAIQSHVIWNWLWECGTCIMWNGSINGGNPAFIDLHGAPAHPLVIVTSAIWGHVVGAKVAIVVSLFVAGLAQWWLAHIFKLNRAVRLWAAALAVVGGHLAGRLEIGVFAVLLSTAFASLAIVAGIALAHDGRRRTAILFAIALSLTLTAGQGYLQLGLLLMLPAYLIFCFDGQLRIQPIWREYALAFCLALLLSSLFLVPLINFWPNIAKETDPLFESSQPFIYNLFNLVINDLDFYNSNALHKHPYPYLYINYIGWVPVIFGLIALRRLPIRIFAFFAVAIGLIYASSSALPFKAIAYFNPDFSGGVRNPSLIAGLAVPLIIGLGAIGLQNLMSAQWPKIQIMFSETLSKSVNVMWISLVVGFAALIPVYEFGQQWMIVQENEDEAAAYLSEKLQSDELRWIMFPFGDGYWLPLAFQADLKIASVVRPWKWIEHIDPDPAMEVRVTLSEEEAEEDLERSERDLITAFEHDPQEETYWIDAYSGALEGRAVERVGNFTLIEYPSVSYAAVQTEEGPIPCRAEGQGGVIDVYCSNEADGTLMVQENAWRGWTAQVDGRGVTLVENGTFLQVELPAGEHYIAFRYRPWDVPIGLLFSLLGVAIAIWQWFRPSSTIEAL